jgi:hypothetical protein
VREIGVPIAEAVRGIGKPAEVAVGTPPQGFLGNRRLVLQRFQLGDLVEQTGKVAVLNAGDLRAIIQIGTRRSAGEQRRDQKSGETTGALAVQD